MTNKFKTALAAIGTAVLLAACGGGGGGGIGGTGPVVDNNAGTPGGIGGTGTGGTGVAFGTVSGYGSVVINGVHYEDNGVTITKADDSKVTGDGASTTTRSALPVGSLVRVDFNGTTTALGFKVDDSISGRIESMVAWCEHHRHGPDRAHRRHHQPVRGQRAAHRRRHPGGGQLRARAGPGR